MKLIYSVLTVLAIITLASCGGPAAPKKQETPVVEKTPEPTPAPVIPSAYKTAEANFKKASMDIPFPLRSSALKLRDPKYRVNDKSIEGYLSDTLLPPLSDLVKSMPADRKIFIDGYASRVGSEKPGRGFIGNIALSQKRAEAVLSFIIKKTGLDKSKFNLRANGSSRPLEGTDPADLKNCRVKLSVE